MPKKRYVVGCVERWRSDLREISYIASINPFYVDITPSIVLSMKYTFLGAVYAMWYASHLRAGYHWGISEYWWEDV